MNKITLSIIIPIYNVEDYLKNCLSSVAGQTINDFEVIMVNDGSTDGSADIAKKFEERYENFRLINQSNQGTAAARNSGIEHARGSYIAFLDGDDLAVGDAYQKLIDTAQNTGACQVRCAYAEFDHFNPDNAEIRRNFNQRTDIESATEMFKHYLKKRIENVVWDGIYKRSLFIDIRFPVGVDYEDHHIIPRLLGKTERLVYLPEPLICYRKRPASVTTSANPEFEADKLRSVYELSEVLKQYGLYEELLSLFSVYFCSFVMHYHQKLIARHPFWLLKGRCSVADLLNDEISDDVINRGGLDKSDRFRLETVIKSHFTYFFIQEKGPVLKELLRGRKTFISLSSNQKVEKIPEQSTPVLKYIKSFS